MVFIRVYHQMKMVDTTKKEIIQCQNGFSHCQTFR